MRFAAVPAVIAGLSLTIADFFVYPLLAINQEDSVLLGLIDAVGWEAAKWILGAAAVGVAWQHLPGRRGVVKVIPVVLGYAIAPLLQATLTTAVDGAPDWMPLVRAGAFGLVILIVGIRMDRAALDGVPMVKGSRLRNLLGTYGLESISTLLTALATPLLLILAVWSAFHGGDVNFPSVDPTQLTRK